MSKPELTQDSAIAVFLSVAKCLKKQHYDPASVLPFGAKGIISAISKMNKKRVIQLVEASLRLEGVRKRDAAKIKVDEVCQQLANHYDRSRKFNYIIVGAPNGGIAHLCAILNAPFLPAYFLYSFRDLTDADDTVAYQQHGEKIADIILKNNPHIRIINHYDPVHDRFLIKYVNHIRVKLLAIPQPYQQFIES
ncbi:MAG: hypothetical protein AB1546_09180, partial [bacterium]